MLLLLNNKIISVDYSTPLFGYNSVPKSMITTILKKKLRVTSLCVFYLGVIDLNILGPYRKSVFLLRKVFLKYVINSTYNIKIVCR